VGGGAVLNSQVDPSDCSLVIFHAALAEHPIERYVGLAQRAASLDLLIIAAQLGFRRVIIVGAEQEFAQAAQLASGLDITLEPDVAPGFHFGQRLLEIVAQQRLERIIYIGGGAAPLLTATDLLALVTAIGGDEAAVVANNVFSADIVALGQAEAALRCIIPPALDNDLAFRLRAAGVPTSALPPSLGLNFDIDTPTDLATLVLALEQHSNEAEAIGPYLRAALADYASSGLADRQLAALHAALGVIRRRDGEALFCGRIGAQTWRRLELALPCQTRLLGEERGMRASGREEQGRVRSLFGLLVEHVGPRCAVADLAMVAQAAFIDTRVLFNHLHLDISIRDRFNSDALRWEQVGEPTARDFTRAAAEADIPLVLGGHSLVSGGLNLLATMVQELHILRLKTKD
jgi:hypothetical protein